MRHKSILTVLDFLKTRKTEAGCIQLIFSRDASLLQFFSLAAELLRRYVPVQVQVEQALLLKVYLGDPRNAFRNAQKTVVL